MALLSGVGLELQRAAGDRLLDRAGGEEGPAK
jgi:hypothetical protein